MRCFTLKAHIFTGPGQRLALPCCLPFAFPLPPARLVVETREAATHLEGQAGSLGVSPAEPLGAGATRGHPLVTQSLGLGPRGAASLPLRGALSQGQLAQGLRALQVGEVLRGQQEGFLCPKCFLLR